MVGLEFSVAFEHGIAQSVLTKINCSIVQVELSGACDESHIPALRCVDCH